MTRLLVTGVSGLLGINLALEAVHNGFDVVGWTNHQTLQNTPFQQATVALENLESLPAALEITRADAVIHCAAIANLDVA
ncbi:MAG: NAD-dependent epimerase/dehydratase family protein, partial [Chloroflexi bacterium]|nr:NAD-dependent epimerase/dehydratase family protein [Chloroflexota bacterium]